MCVYIFFTGQGLTNPLIPVNTVDQIKFRLQKVGGSSFLKLQIQKQIDFVRFRLSRLQLAEMYEMFSNL